MGFDIYSSVRTPNPLDEMKDENYSEWEQVEELLGNYAHFTITAWPKLIQMARTYGWQPTVINTYEMGYSVTAEEAAALGEALIKALDDIPDTTAPNLMVEYGPGEQRPPANDLLGVILKALGDDSTVEIQNPNLHPFGFFGGVMKKKVKNFITLCGKGGFEVT